MKDFLDSFYPHIIDVFQAELLGSCEYTQTIDERFIYVHNGRGSAEIGDVTYALATGSVLQIPGLGTAVLRNSANGPLRYYCIQYDYKLIEWKETGIRCVKDGSRFLPFDSVLQVPDAVAVLEEIHVMHRIWTQKQSGYSGKTKLAFMNVLNRLLERQKSSHAALTTERSILECVEYIEQNYQEMFERDALAKRFSISSSYFSVLFKKYVGCSPVQYITKVRIEKAMELLMDSSISVSAVALEVGFNDPLYFTRVFSRQVGVTPKQYREGTFQY